MEKTRPQDRGSVRHISIPMHISVDPQFAIKQEERSKAEIELRDISSDIEKLDLFAKSKTEFLAKENERLENLTNRIKLATEKIEELGEGFIRNLNGHKFDAEQSIAETQKVLDKIPGQRAALVNHQKQVVESISKLNKELIAIAKKQKEAFDADFDRACKEAAQKATEFHYNNWKTNGGNDKEFNFVLFNPMEVIPQ